MIILNVLKKFHELLVEFHDFPGLENSFLKFHDFPWCVGTLLFFQVTAIACNLMLFQSDSKFCVVKTKIFINIKNHIIVTNSYEY